MLCNFEAIWQDALHKRIQIENNADEKGFDSFKLSISGDPRLVLLRFKTCKSMKLNVASKIYVYLNSVVNEEDTSRIMLTLY